MNYIGLFKLSNIVGKKRDLVPKPSGDDTEVESDSSSDEDDDEDESNKSSVPVLQVIIFFL